MLSGRRGVEKPRPVPKSSAPPTNRIRILTPLAVRQLMLPQNSTGAEHDAQLFSRAAQASRGRARRTSEFSTNPVS